MALVRFLIVFFLIFDPVFAMDSENYSVPKDGLSSSGSLSTSDNYELLHNFGENIIGTSSSDNYNIDAGYIEPARDVLLFTISDINPDLGLLDTNSVSTGEVRLNVSTSSMFGYTIQAYDNTPEGISNGLVDGSNTIDDIALPNSFVLEPGAGSEYYGLTVTGVHANSNFENGNKFTALDNNTLVTLASFNDYITDDYVDVSFHSSISNSTLPGNYQSSSTYICTSAF